MSAIADEIFSLVERLFTVIAESRGEDIIWDVKGLSTRGMEDRNELILEAAALATLMIPSDTFNKEYHYSIAARLVEGTDQRTLQTIRKEIEDGLKSIGLEPGQSVNAKNADQAAEKAASLAPVKPQTTSASSAAPERKVDKNGQEQAPEGSHLQTGQHIDPQIVYDQLKGDYDDKYIQFVMSVPWMGPVSIPLSSIDFSNKDNWEASDRTKKVEQFADMIGNEGFAKPIIVVNEMSNNGKMVILDGHTRALAYLELNKPVVAYVGQVGKVTKEMTAMHSMQAQGESGGDRVLESNQKVKSNQKLKN
jgi:hypothetical protein